METKKLRDRIYELSNNVNSRVELEIELFDIVAKLCYDYYIETENNSIEEGFWNGLYEMNKHASKIIKPF